MMRTLVLSAFALGALTTAVLADSAAVPGAPVGPEAALNLRAADPSPARAAPVELSDEQMDRVTAGDRPIDGETWLFLPSGRTVVVPTCGPATNGTGEVNSVCFF